MPVIIQQRKQPPYKLLLLQDPIGIFYSPSATNDTFLHPVNQVPATLRP
jgi:hypothetical protein